MHFANFRNKNENAIVRKNENDPNRYVLVSKVVDAIEPIGIIVYGPAADDIFITPRFMGIPIYPFKSFMQKRNSSRKKKKEGGVGDEE